LASYGQKQNSLEKLEKMQEHQKHGKKLQKLIFLIKTAGLFLRWKTKNTNSKVKTEQPHETFRFYGFHGMQTQQARC
jgi:hypothetical protein